MGLFFELPNEEQLKSKYPKPPKHKNIFIKQIKEEVDKITYYTLNGSEEQIKEYFPFVINIRGNETKNHLYFKEFKTTIDELIQGEIVNKYEIDKDLLIPFNDLLAVLIKPKVKLNDTNYHLGFIYKEAVTLIQLPLDQTSKKLNKVNVLLKLYLRLLEEEKRDETAIN